MPEKPFNSAQMQFMDSWDVFFNQFDHYLQQENHPCYELAKRFMQVFAKLPAYRALFGTLDPHTAWLTYDMYHTEIQLQEEFS